ncbi:cuticle protein LPCP-23-like [Sitophilus oryzae]|uniref:Cuticle protein LPCP-23-like n=1 Tax=Sitophilus oryzae TaxID=7048 RepID=A0A6J2YQM6_SITOR|nr:cuticle protein LPCP-23-like [Sitophilus oryzae]
MNTYAFITFFAFVAAANAGYYPSAKILQGPSSKTTIVGPDGSAISAVAPGGSIIHEEHPGYIAHSAPLAHHAPLAYAAHAPVVAPLAYVAHAPVVAQHAPVVAQAYAAPIALGHETHISKYGTHITHGAPAVYSSVVEPVAYASHGLYSSQHHHGLYAGHQGLYAGHQGLYL